MSRRLKEENPGQIILMPIAAIITIIPLIVFSKFVKLSEMSITYENVTFFVVN